MSETSERGPTILTEFSEHSELMEIERKDRVNRDKSGKKRRQATFLGVKSIKRKGTLFQHSSD